MNIFFIYIQFLLVFHPVFLIVCSTLTVSTCVLFPSCSRPLCLCLINCVPVNFVPSVVFGSLLIFKLSFSAFISQLNLHKFSFSSFQYWDKADSKVGENEATEQKNGEILLQKAVKLGLHHHAYKPVHICLGYLLKMKAKLLREGQRCFLLSFDVMWLTEKALKFS